MPNLLAGVEAEVLGAEPGRRALGAWGFGRCVFALAGFEVVAQALNRGADRRRNVGRIGQRRQLREFAHPERPGQAGFRQQDHEAAAFKDARDVQVEGVGHVLDVEPVDGAGVTETLETGLGAGAGGGTAMHAAPSIGHGGGAAGETHPGSAGGSATGGVVRVAARVAVAEGGWIVHYLFLYDGGGLRQGLGGPLALSGSAPQGRAIVRLRHLTGSACPFEAHSSIFNSEVSVFDAPIKNVSVSQIQTAIANAITELTGTRYDCTISKLNFNSVTGAKMTVLLEEYNIFLSLQSEDTLDDRSE